MADTKLEATITLKDEFSDKLKNVDSGLTKLGKTSTNITARAKALGKEMLIVGGAVGATATALAGLSYKLAKDAAPSLDLARGFARNFGKEMESNMDILRRASRSTIADVDLMQTANRAALLGVTNNVDDLARLMVTASLRGREMGLSTTQAFNDIVTGIGRGSPLILDNLGIKIPDALTKSMESMDEAQKMQTLLNFAMEDGDKISKEYGGKLDSNSDAFERLGSKMANAKEELGLKLLPFVNKSIESFEILSNTIGSDEKLRGSVNNLKDALVGLGEQLGVVNSQGIVTEQTANKISKGLTWITDSLTKVTLGWKGFIEVLPTLDDTARKYLYNFFVDLEKKVLQVDAKLRKFANTLADISTLGLSKVIRDVVGDEPKYKSMSQMATGTMYSQGGLTLVGERGAELVNLPRGSKVTPNESVRGQGGTVNINIDVSGSMITNQEAFIERLTGEISRAISNQSRLNMYGIQ